MTAWPAGGKLPVPLRPMCPHADLLLGRATHLDPGAGRSRSSPRPGGSSSPTPTWWWRSAPSPGCRRCPGWRSTRRGIEIVGSTALQSVDAGGATLTGGRRVAARTVVWTAGVAPNPLVAQLGLPTDEQGRVEVGESLAVPGVPGVWALGDCAAVPNRATPGALDPPTCRHALRQARRLASNVGEENRPYRYRTRGHMATLGRRHGIAVLGRIRVRGLAGWAVARVYHLALLPFTARRVRVLGDWIAAACFRRDVAELTLVQERA